MVSRIKRISLMTPDLDQSISFFTRVIGFTLNYQGTLPPGGEPFLGPVFNIDASKPIRRALLSTSTEARGLFLIEHPEAPAPVKLSTRPERTHQLACGERSLHSSEQGQSPDPSAHAQAAVE